MKKYKFLDKVEFPSDIRKLKLSELKILSNEVREELIDAVSVAALLTTTEAMITDKPEDKSSAPAMPDMGGMGGMGGGMPGMM